LNDLVARIRTAPGYTAETASLLGLTLPGGPTLPIGAIPPVLKAAVDPGNIVQVRFVRGFSDGVLLQTNVDGGGWTDRGVRRRSPAVFAVEANEANTPRGVQIRARFLEADSPVGDWSQIETVQTIP
jgi:hypothetical protein